jgi:outer membrane protein assembly factor BamD (BamD/ComL family)
MIRRGKRRKSVAVGASILLVAMAVMQGCGKSATDLYTEGKSLVRNPATIEKGLATLEQFTKRFPKDPRAPEAMLALATINQNEERFPEAEAAYTRVTERYPGTAESYKALFLLGYMYYECTKDTEKAKTALTRFIAAYPDSGLTVSAKVLLENIGRPVEEWSTVKKIGSEQETAPVGARGSGKKP